MIKKNVEIVFSSLKSRMTVGLAVMAAGVLSAADASAASAASGNGVGAIATTVSANIQNVGNLLLSGSFLAGVGLAGAGLFKVKKAADSDGRDPYGPGLWRLGIGGALVGLPALTAAMRGTLFGSDTTAPTPTGMNFLPGGSAGGSAGGSTIGL